MEIWDNGSGLGNGMEGYGAAGAKRSSIYFYTSTSFIFVSLKTFHEELKTSSFVFLSPVSCSSALSSDHVTTKMFVEMKIYILRLEIVLPWPLCRAYNLYWSPRRISS